MNEGITEAQTVSQLIGFTGLLLSGVSVFFTVVSVYIAALNYFIRRASLGDVRIGAFVFFSSILAMLMMIFVGARRAQAGLVEHLGELAKSQSLTKARAGAPEQCARRSEPAAFGDQTWSFDNFIRETAKRVRGWVGRLQPVCGFALTYLALCGMTFVFRWGEARGAEK